MKKYLTTLLAAMIAYGLIAPAGVSAEVSVETASPRTYCRFVPERQDDFAWENDKVAFRVYGPALRSKPENSGIDCWTKSVSYPIVDKWYKQREYHQDHGEGCDMYHVGASAGCGGSALWLNGKREPLETYVKQEVLLCTPEKSSFKLTYEREIDGTVYGEERTFTIGMGTQLFEVHSVFTKNGTPAADLPVCVGVTTHGGKAHPTSNKEKGWIACGETSRQIWMGTAALMNPSRIDEIKVVESEDKDVGHILILCHTDANGAIDYKAGFAWGKAGEIKDDAQWEAYLNKQ